MGTVNNSYEYSDGKVWKPCVVLGTVRENGRERMFLIVTGDRIIRVPEMYVKKIA